MGCGASELVVVEEEFVFRDQTPVPDSYPPPNPPRSRKKDVYKESDMKRVDEIARKVPSEKLDEYTNLLNHLTGHCKDDTSKIRAIFVWLSTLDLHTPPEETIIKMTDSPAGYITYMMSGNGDLPEFFAILSRKVNIPCVIIDGYGKASTYEAGDAEEVLNEMRNRWNAVYVNGCWRLVHVYWGTMGLMDRDNINPKANPGSKTIRRVNDYFFFTDPDEFVTRCLPDDPEWQLTDKRISWEEYVNLPYYRPAFFQKGLKVTSLDTCGTTTADDQYFMEILTPVHLADDFIFSYNLCEKAMDIEKEEENSLQDETMYVPPRMNQYVFMQRRESNISFKVLLPCAGIYLFDLVGGYSKRVKSVDDMSLLCQFCLICSEVSEEKKEPFPDSPLIGWGPGIELTKHGLTPKIYKDGIITINPGEHKTLKFRIDSEMDLSTKLVHSSLPFDKLKNCTRHAIDMTKHEFRVSVSVPEEGQYAMKMFVRNQKTEQLENICNYFLIPNNTGKPLEKIRNRMLRARLEEAIEEGDEGYLRKARDLFLVYAVPDDGELTRANDRFQFFQLQKDIHDARKRHNIPVLRKIIDIATKSQFKDELQFDIQQAEAQLKRLEDLKGYLHPIMKMTFRTFSEIHSYCRPPVVVQDVIRATYVLLGEKEDNLTGWSRIQGMMGRSSREYLLKRILDLRVEQVPQEAIDTADVILEPHDLLETRGVSIGAAAFYIWAKGIINERRSGDGVTIEGTEETTQVEDNETDFNEYDSTEQED